MAEATTIARPYAVAVFEIAKEKGELKAWSELLALFAQCVSDQDMQSIIRSPSVSDVQVVDLLADIAGDKVDQTARAFLQLLAENKRLLLLGAIAEIFEALRAEAEQNVIADVISARPLTPEQEKSIAAALKRRLGKNVMLKTDIDESLLGGAIIRAGDLVIDGSALGKLNRLANALS